MKVLYIGGFELPDKNAAAHRVTANVKILTKLGCITKLVGVYKHESEKIDEHQVKYPKNTLEWLVYLIGANSTFKLINQFRPDVIIAYNFPALALIRIYTICKKQKIRLIADCTEWYQADGNIIVRIIKQIDTFVRMNLIHPRLNGVIAISRYLYDFYKDKTMTILVPPLVDLSDSKWRLTEYTPSEKMRLIYAGKPGTGNKDILENLIEAIESIEDDRKADIQLDILGVDSDDYFRNHKKASSNVKFWGSVDHLSALRAIQSSDFSVFFRMNNRVTKAGFPSKLVESLACGTPVITNVSSNIQEFIVDGENCIILEDASINSIVKGIKKALKMNPIEKYRMKAKCKESDCFKIEKYVDRFALILHMQSNKIENGYKHE